MPFEVFRRHQRKLLATLAILAMFAFVVSDSLPRLLSSNIAARDSKVAELYGKSVHQSELNDLARQRFRANQFLAGLGARDFFGGLKQRDLVDAMILQHEADRLGIPATTDMGRQWLTQRTNGRMTAELFGTLYSRFSNEVSEEQLLSDIANQARLLSVRQLLGFPEVTPYDVYRLYADQTERVGAKLVEIPVESFLAKVPEPSADEVQALYDTYKDVLPDAARETPGFKVPRRVQVEILSLDGNALARGIRDKLTEEELRTFYENHKTEFEIPSELPRDLFAEQPELTPPVLQPFADVRSLLAPRLAEERAQIEIQDKFAALKDQEMIPFAETYLSALDDLEEARKQKSQATAVLPEPADLKAVAEKAGMHYEKTDLMSREQAERYSLISSAEVGLTPLSGGRRFAEELFDPKTGLYEPVELTDALGTRFLVRKVKDQEPHVPPLDHVRSDVVLAWKTARARPLAQKAADELAKQLQSRGGAIKETRLENYRVITVPPITRTQMNFLPTSLFEPAAPVDTPIPEVAHAGSEFRDQYFGLQPGAVVVASNQPRTAYYVMTLDRREPATFAALYAPNGDEFRFSMMARQEAARQQDSQWMTWLRQQAGLKPDWVPPDELKKDDSSHR